MLGGNEFRLREVGGFAANFNRANKRGDGFAVFDARSARGIFGFSSQKVGTSARSAEV